MGTSGCVIVVAFMVSWTLRDGSGTKPTKARNLAALALSLLVAVYLYAYAVLSCLVGLMVATQIYQIAASQDSRVSGLAGTE